MRRKTKKITPKGKRGRGVKRAKRRVTPKKKTSLRRTRKNLPRAKTTHRRKRKASAVTRKTTRAKISTTGSKSFYITREKIKYRRSRSVTQKKRKYHVTGVEKEFEKFYRKHRRKGKSFIGRMQITINAHGKKMKQWVSLPRKYLADAGEAKNYILRGLEDDLRKLLRQYEIDRAASSISVSEVQFEVKRGNSIALPSRTNQNTARARKKWGRQSKPPA